MDNDTELEKCNCPMECNSISYSFSIVSSPFDPQKMCPSSKSIKDDDLMKEFYKNRFPQNFIRRLNAFLGKDVSSQEHYYCKRNIEYRAEVTFRLASNSIPVTVISRRLSFFDKMSAFGKSKH